MTAPLACAAARPLLAGLAADALEDEDAPGGVAALRAHAAACDGCAAALAAVAEALDLTRAAHPAPAAPDDVWARLEDAIAREVVSGSSERLVARAADSGARPAGADRRAAAGDSRGAAAGDSGARPAGDSRGGDASDLGPPPSLDASPFEVERAPDGAEVRRFGPYVVEGVLARGGMGVVYRARRPAKDGGDDEVVALKVLREGLGASEAQVRRFRAEAEAAKALAHPGIVAVRDVGCRGGLHYHTLELVEGEALDQVVRRRERLPVERVLDLLIDVALAVEHAHERGVVHRDLKPANILLDADGAPKVTDFGLAKRLDRPRAHRSDAIVGTPHYMAPEQARGDQALDGRADVFSLGVIAYELLTLELPFPGTTPLEVANRIIDEEPTPPRRLDPRITPDLEAVVLRALEKDPARRYASARALADDLRRARHGERTEARPVTAFARWRRGAGRPLRVAAGLLLGAAVAGGVAALEVRRRQGPDRSASPDALAARRAEDALRAATAALAEAEAALAADHVGAALAAARRGLDALRLPAPGPGPDAWAPWAAALAVRSAPLARASWGLRLVEGQARLRGEGPDAAQAAADALRPVVARQVECLPEAWGLGAPADLAVPPGAPLALSTALLRLDDLDGARRAAQAAADLPALEAREAARARLALARVEVTAGAWPAAGADLDRALALLIAVPDALRVEALALRAGVRLLAGDLAGARADADEALRAAPLDPGALTLRGRARLAAGDPGGLADLDAAVAAAPTAAGPRLARAAARLADPGGARADLEAALRAAPGSPEAALAAARLARLDLADDDADAARDRLSALLGDEGLARRAARGVAAARQGLATAAAALAEVELDALDLQAAREAAEERLDAGAGEPAGLDDVLSATNRQVFEGRARVEALLARARALAPDEPLPALVQARLALRLDFTPAAARAALARARRAPLGDPAGVGPRLDAWRALAALRAGDDPAGADRHAAACLALDPSSALALAVRAQVARERGDLAAAREAEGRARAARLSGAGLAGAALVRGRAAAAPLLDPAADPAAAPDDPAALARARRALVLACAEDPLAAEAWLLRARLAARAGHGDVAVALAHEATTAAPADPAPRLLVGLLFARDLPTARDPATGRPVRVRDAARGERALRQAVAVAPSDAQAVEPRRALAALALARADAAPDAAARAEALAQADEHLTRAAAALPGAEGPPPDDAPAEALLAAVAVHGQLAAVRGRRGDEPAARQASAVEARLRDAARRLADDAVARARAATDEATAHAALARALALDPERADARAARGALRLRAGDAGGFVDLARGLEAEAAVLQALRAARPDVAASALGALDARLARGAAPEALRQARALVVVARAEAGVAAAAELASGLDALPPGFFRALLAVREAVATGDALRTARLAEAVDGPAGRAPGAAAWVRALAEAVRADDPGAAPDSARQARARAVAALREALAAGFVDADRVRTERVFNRLRAEPEVQALLGR